MPNINLAIIQGHLGKDPEVRFTPQGRAVARFSIATTRRWKDGNGEKQEATTWHNIVCWTQLAENCGKYLVKGQLATVQGRIETRSYDDKDGQKRWVTEIIADRVDFGPSPDGARRDDAPAAREPGEESEDFGF